MDIYDYSVSCSEGLEHWLAEELQELGLHVEESGRGYVLVAGELVAAYRAVLWSRLASRVLMPFYRSAMQDLGDLTAWVASLPWEQHFASTATLSVRATTGGQKQWPAQLAALRCKDGYVDRMRTLTGARPSVDAEAAQVPLFLHAEGGEVVVGLDLSGGSLHRRGWRTQVGAAPIKETLAAAMLRLSGWPGNYTTLVDPLCGSGTLLLEAWMMAADIAPGLRRHERVGFLHWNYHEDQVWQDLLRVAAERGERGRALVRQSFWGQDADPVALQRAHANLDALSPHLQLRQRSLHDLPAGDAGTLIITNPPYGERLSSDGPARALYQALGRLARQHAPGAAMTVIAPDAESLDALALDHLQSGRVSHGGTMRYVRHGRVRACKPLHLLRADGEATAPWLQDIAQAWQQRSADVACLYDGDDVRVEYYGSLLKVIARHERVDWPTLLPPLRHLFSARKEQVRLARIGRSAAPDWQDIEVDGQLYRLDMGRTDDSGWHLPWQGLYARLQEDRPARVLHLFAGNASLALRLPQAQVLCWDRRTSMQEWALTQWALNGYAEADLIWLQGDPWVALAEQEGFDRILVTPPHSHHAEQQRQGFRWREQYAVWTRHLRHLLRPQGELWWAIDEKGFQPEATLPCQEHDLLPGGFQHLRGRLRFFCIPAESMS